MKHFSSISEFLNYMNLPETKNENLYFCNIEKIDVNSVITESDYISTDFYFICEYYLNNGNIVYGKSEYNYENGILTIVKPGQTIKWSDISIINKGYVYIIHKKLVERSKICKEIFKYTTQYYSTNYSIPLNEEQEKCVNNIFQNIEIDYNSMDISTNYSVFMLYKELLLNYSEIAHQGMLQDENTSSKLLSITLRKLILSLINSKVSKQPGVYELAEKVNMTVTKINRILQNETGMNLKRYINHVIIEEAKERLMAPNVTVSEVAFSLGFNHSQYFSRIFKQLESCTPKEYRNSKQ